MTKVKFKPIKTWEQFDEWLVGHQEELAKVRTKIAHLQSQYEFLFYSAGKLALELTERIGPRQYPKEKGEQ